MGEVAEVEEVELLQTYLTFSYKNISSGGVGADGASKIDRRPSMILVTGYPDDCNKEELVSHFRKFGEVTESLEQVRFSREIQKYFTKKKDLWSQARLRIEIGFRCF